MPHAGFRRFRPHYQEGYSRHRPRYIGRHKRDLDGAGAGRHQYVEGAQQVPLGADALNDTDLSEAVQVQPTVIS